jgi:hypothetical protein
MQLTCRRSKNLAALTACFMLAGCGGEPWQVLSVDELVFPDDCDVAREQFDSTAGPEGVPGWTGASTAEDRCATVFVKLLESDPTEPLPDGLTLTTTFTLAEDSGEPLRRGAGYTIADPEAVSKLRVVGFIARGADAAEQAKKNSDGYLFEVGGNGIAPASCTLHLGRGAVDCD